MTITKESAAITANKIYDKFIGVTTASTYSRVAEGDYDPVTGESPDLISTQKIKIVFLSINRQQDNFDQIAPSDIKALIPTDDLKFVVETGDKMTRGNRNYKVKGYELIAADSLWKLHLEETN